MPITDLPTPVPARTMSQTAFDSAFAALVAALPTFVTEANALETNVNSKEASAVAAAAEASASETNAAASESAAALTVGAAMWDAATNYTTGQAAISPTDLQTYRRKAPGGVVATDPAADSTNWTKLGSSGIGSVASVTDSTTLTSSSAGYQSAAMTAIGKAFTLPDATTMTVGGPRFIIKNDGGYPFGIRDNAGTLVGAVAAGGIAYVTLKDNGSAAGSWSVIGENLEPGLITIDNTFSSTYASTVLKPFVALDDNKSIHFLALASGFAAVAVDKTTGAVGTPLTISATASSVPKQCFKIDTSRAIVFYGADTTTLRAAVITLSGATTLAVGTEDSVAQAGLAVEDFSGAPKIAQLSSTSYLVSYATATGAGNTSVIAFSVSGTTITNGGKYDIIAANNVANSTTTYALTATTALVFYLSGTAPYAVNAVVISVSGTTCTVGTPASIAGIHAGTVVPSTCLLSATKALVVTNNNDANVYAYAATVSGTTVSFGAALNVEAIASQSRTGFTSDSATRYNPHLFTLSSSTALFWYLDGSSISRAVVLSESGGTVTAGTKLYNSISIGAATAAGGGAVIPQGTAEFVAIRAQSAAGTFDLMPHKISGTTITTGSGAALREIPPTRVDQVWFARLTSGDYVHIGGTVNTSTSQMGVQELPVFRTNGDAINMRGRIKVPALMTSAAGVTWAPVVLSSNRLVILGASIANTVAVSTFQLRLLSVEICA